MSRGQTAKEWLEHTFAVGFVPDNPTERLLYDSAKSALKRISTAESACKDCEAKLAAAKGDYAKATEDLESYVDNLVALGKPKRK